jgi:hypothetical protein
VFEGRLFDVSSEAVGGYYNYARIEIHFLSLVSPSLSFSGIHLNMPAC